MTDAPPTGGRTAIAPREHGGDLGAAIRAHGAAPGDRPDLSTGIDRCASGPPPHGTARPDLPPGAWRRLPEPGMLAGHAVRPRLAAALEPAGAAPATPAAAPGARPGPAPTTAPAPARR